MHRRAVRGWLTSVSARDLPRGRHAAVAFLALIAAAAAAILSVRQPGVFIPYFGSLKPPLVIAIVTVIAVPTLTYLRARPGLQVFSAARSLRGALFAAAVSPLFAAIAISLDISFGFPREINVSLPWSLLFYPSIAFVVEIVFHVLPMALLLTAMGWMLMTPATSARLGLCIILVSLIEPAFQLKAGSVAGGSPWFAVFLGLHLFAFNLVQLYVYRRYDFVSMYLFRIAFYLQWHILWGYLRLQLLF